MILPFSLFANVVLFVHLLVVVFVVGGLVFVVVGNRVGWTWVNSLWFRGTHLATIVFVVAESWFGMPCPLTTLEAWLRVQDGGGAHGQDFIAYWIGRVLFYDAPPWVFTLVYTLFGVLVAAVWWVFPPHPARRSKRRDSG